MSEMAQVFRYNYGTPVFSNTTLTPEGIVQGNDPYLYGEKVRAYLRKGARQLPGFTQWPNDQLGYGALCLRESLPE